jgi:hypothetical protein
MGDVTEPGTGSRAAAAVLLCVLVWPVPSVVGSAIEASIAWFAVPPFPLRIALAMLVDAVRFGMMIAAIRFAGDMKMPAATIAWLVLAGAIALDVVATAGNVALTAGVTMLVARTSDPETLSAFARDSSIVGIIGVLSATLSTAGAAAYAVARAVRQTSRDDDG